MPKRIVALFLSLVVPDTEENSSMLPIGYQSAGGVGRKDKNAADSNKVVSVSAPKPVLQKQSSQVKPSVIFLMMMQKSALFCFFQDDCFY